MQSVPFSSPSPNAQQSLCQQFFAARADWPDFGSEIPSRAASRELSFQDLVVDAPQSVASIMSAFAGERIGQERFVTALWNSGDGKIYSLGRIILQFDLTDLAAQINEFGNSATLSRSVEVPPQLGPAWPDLVEVTARRLHDAAVLPSEVDESYHLLRRSTALNQLERTMIYTRIGAENMQLFAAGKQPGALERRVLENALSHIIEGLRGFDSYLNAYHSERQPDLSAAVFGAGQGRAFDHESNVLSGSFSVHVRTISGALESVAAALAQVNQRLFTGR